MLLSLLLSAVGVEANYQAFHAPGTINTGNTDFSAAIVVNSYVTYQTMIGGGCSGAFNVACQQFGADGLSAAKQQEVTQTLFDENIGGLSVLRNDIGSGNGTSGQFSILENCPATPAGPFNYTFNNNDSCQLELSQTALKYNPNLFIYADAWSAPGCMKTNKNEDNGGLICGVRGSNCTYDWRQAYADYLVQYVRYYENAGINISMLGAYNEPDYNPVTYSSMESDGFQAKDFLEILYPTVKAAYPHLDVSCCDATGFRQERTLLYELEKAGGGNLFDVATWHNYQSEPTQKFPTSKPNMMTEWADGTGDWNAYWDVTGDLAEGFQWAMYMYDAFTISDTSGYLHWWCFQNTTGDGALIRGQYDDYFVSARLWAFAQYFRFARPGAVRVDALSSVEEVSVTAWVNENGTVAIPVINQAQYTYNLNIDLYGVNVTSATAYLTNNNHNVSMVGQTAINGSRFQATVEPRSMKTFFLQ